MCLIPDKIVLFVNRTKIIASIIKVSPAAYTGILQGSVGIMISTSTLRESKRPGRKGFLGSMNARIESLRFITGFGRQAEGASMIVENSHLSAKRLRNVFAPTENLFNLALMFWHRAHQKDCRHHPPIAG